MLNNVYLYAFLLNTKSLCYWGYWALH